MIRLLIIFLFSCGNPEKIVKVHDGDTFYTETHIAIRLAEVDAPEIDQPYGQEAKVFVENEVLNKSINITFYGKDKYGRTIASISVDGKDLAELLVQHGLAHVTPWTKSNLLRVEYNKAKSDHTGLFSTVWEYPYIWRKKQVIELH